MIAAILVVATLQPATAMVDPAALAHRIALATFQPDKAVADAMTNYDQQFEASFKRAAAGRPLTLQQTKRYQRIKTIGHNAMEAQMRADAVPVAMATIEAEYRSNYSGAELREIAEFWDSPAGRALTAETQAAVIGVRPITPPAEFAERIYGYYASPTGRKEQGRSANAQAELARVMGAAMQRVLVKSEAAIAAVANRP